MVVLEGMLHGLAVAAEDVGGPAEILTDNHTVCLVPPRDGPALARALAGLIDDAQRRERIAADGARCVRDKWLWPQLMPKFEALYSDLLQANFVKHYFGAKLLCAA